MPGPDHTASADLIFVSIASYRDQQLVPTIKDCLQKASHPDRLRFGICWQHGPEEPALPFADDSRFQILDVEYHQSRGACWARAEIMKVFRGEAWFLQVDSHCRFTAEWDVKLLAEIAQTGSTKPILSTYASPFTPGDAYTNEVLTGSPQLMAISSFNPEGLPHLKPIGIPDTSRRRKPMRARFLAAGFLFAPGTFVEEVGYDPDLYFFGEEIAMTLRAYTHGYDLFHPWELIVWHDYVRAYATRHWDDHESAEQTKQAWERFDKASRGRVNQLLRGELTGKFGLGPARTLEDYEAYAGLSFRARKIQDDTRRALEPPNAEVDPDWQAKIYPWLVRILIDPKRLAPAAFEDPAFWYVTLQDEDRNEIHRHDFPTADLAAFTGQESRIALVVELESGIIPVYWTVWPVSKLRGWLSKIEGKLEEGDYAIVNDDEDEAESSSL